MLRRLGHRFAAVFRAITPDPFVLAVALTLVVFALAMAVEGVGPVAVIRAWQGDKGFWSLLAFTMQMILILVTGHALASSPPVRRAIAALARVPRSGPQAAALVALVAMATALLNWGLGLIVGAIVAREVGRSCRRRGVAAHYPLVAAAGYAGLLCWHGGLSGSAPLMMTTPANVSKFLGGELAARVGTLPMTSTVLSPGNVIATGGLLLIVPALAAALAPRGDDEHQPFTGDDEPPVAAPPESTSRDPDALGLAQRAEHSGWLTACAVLPLGAACLLWMRDTGFARLEPNALNLLFLTLGLALHGTLHRYSRAVGEAVRGVSGIVLQFPFYAGIMGVMRTTGLASTMAGAMASAASPASLGVVTMTSAGIINLFVPSGGGQWAVQGPIALDAAQRLGTSSASAVMAVAYGDQLTNMLQPFWALPLLAITGVAARDIIGYTAVWMLAAGAWLAGCLWLLG